MSLRTVSTRQIRALSQGRFTQQRFYSAGHGEEHHEEHHDEHHDHHHAPLAPEENLFSKPVLYTIASVFAFWGVYRYNEYYQEKHGKPFGSMWFTPEKAEELKAKYVSYQDDVKLQSEILRLLNIRPRRDENNYTVVIDGVPGKSFPSNGFTSHYQVDFEKLEPRKKIANPYE